MKNKKFPKWLHRLPVLLTALLIFVSPLAVSADASVLNGVTVREFPDYTCIGSIVIGNQSGFVYVPSFYWKGYAVYDTNDGFLYSVTGSPPRIEYPFANLPVFYDVAILAPGERVVDGATIYVFYDFVEYDKDSLDDPFDMQLALNFVDPDLKGFDSIPDSFLQQYVIIPPSNVPGVLSVFSGVGIWLSGVVQNISTMFWSAETGLTVLGYLAVASLALAVILLIFYFIAGWLKFH